MERLQIYKCDKCGNLVAKLNDAKGTLSCCNTPMRLVKAGTTEAAVEKHIPVVEKKLPHVAECNRRVVKVGSVMHPQTAEHWIDWIAITTNDYVKFHFTKDLKEPVIEFTQKGDADVYAYCNLHGLWKAA